MDTPNPQSQPVDSPDTCPSPDDPTQDVDKSHLCDSTSTSTNFNESCSLDTPRDHLLCLDSPSLSSELQDTTSVESVEIEFVSDLEEPLENNKFSPTDVFSVQHDYDLFLLNQEINTPSNNLNHQDTHVCEKQGQDDFLIHAMNLSHNFALPQFMAQHICEDLKPTDTPSTVSTFTQATSDHTSNPICAHNPSTSQVSQANLSISLTSQYPPDPGEHVLKKSATEIGEQDFPLKQFKFIYPSSKPRMTETSTLTPVHVAYSPIAFMNHQCTISLHDGYLPLHVLLPEEYIAPSPPTLCNLKSSMFHFCVDLLYSTTEPQHDLPSLTSPKGEMASSFSWTSLFKSPTSSTLCFGDPTLAKLDQVKLLCETEFCITKSIPLCDPVVHTGTTFLLTSRTLPHKPKMYLQDKPSTPPSEVPSGETEEATPIHLSKSTSNYPIELRILLPLTKSCPSTSR